MGTQQTVFMDGATNGGQSVLKWNLALDENNGPHCQGGSCCTSCEGVVTIPSGATHIDNVTFNVDFYGLAHHSAFLEEGAQVIQSSIEYPQASANGRLSEHEKVTIGTRSVGVASYR